MPSEGCVKSTVAAPLEVFLKRLAKWITLTTLMVVLSQFLPSALVTLGVATPGIDFSLVPGGSISGTVTDVGTGLPLSGVRVEIWNSSGFFAGLDFTDGAGFYTVPGLTAGTYFASTENFQGYTDELYDDMSCPGGAFVGCTPTNGTPIAVATATNTAGIDFDLVLGPTGDITGTVVDSVSGSPLSSIEVEVFDSNGFFLDSGFTNGAGVYTVTGLPTGNVFARTDNFQGYLDELFDDLPCFFGCTPTSGTAIAVMTGVTTPGIDFALDPGGSVSGNITDSVSGLPISGIEVEIWDMGGSFLGSNSSDGQGDYMVSGLPGGNVFATTSNFQGYLDELYDDFPCPGGAYSGCIPTSGDPIAVVVAMDTPGIDFDLDPMPTGGISGTLTDSVTGFPLLGVEVEVFNSGGGFEGSGFTDSAGDYTVSGLPIGTVFARTDNFQGYLDELYDDLPCFSGCTPTSGTAIAVTTGVTTPGIDFALDPGGTISGVVLDSGTGLPISGIEVEIWDAGEFLAGSDFTDGAGVYAVSGLKAGTHFATTINFQGYNDELYDDMACPGGAFAGCAPAAGTPIAVMAATTTAGIDFDLVLQPTGSLSGTIMDGDTGLPLSGIEVEVFNSSGFFVDNDFTDGSGFYTVSGLPPGTFFARTDNFQSYLDELYNNLACFSGCSVTSGTPIGVTAGMTTTGIDFSLGLSGSIIGMVTDAVTGSPLGGIEVEVFNSVGGFVANGFTNGAGLYSVNGLPTGTYFARSDNFQGYMDKLFDDLPCSPGCVPTTGTPIFVSSGFTGIGGTGDFNGDGIVGAADLVAVLLNLGGTNPACDVNEDGVVDNDDLVALTELIFTQ